MVGKSEKESRDGERGQRHPAAARDAVLVGSPCQEATQRAAQTRGLASRPAPCPKLRAPYPELQNFGYRRIANLSNSGLHSSSTFHLLEY